MIAVADSAETKDQWVSGCNAVIKGQVYVVTNAQPSLAPEPLCPADSRTAASRKGTSTPCFVPNAKAAAQ